MELNEQAAVVQTLVSAIQWIRQLVSLILIHWMVIYPMDNAIQSLNNWAQRGCLVNRELKRF